MSARSPRRAVAAVIAAAIGAATFSVANPAPTVAGPPVSLAVPAYFTDEALWKTVLDTPEVQYVIGHPLAPEAGTKYEADKELAARLVEAKAKGKIPLVYVTGGYDKVDFKVVADRIDTILNAYPAAAGVFIDEINYDQCEKYSALVKGSGTVKGVRARQPNKLVVLNPGAPLLNCYEGLADGYLNLERANKDVADWVKNVSLPGNVPFYQWMFTEANRGRIWEMVHSVTPANAVEAVDQAMARNASVIYITDDVMPNPYDSLPTEATWKAVLNRVSQYSSGQVALPAVLKLPTPAKATPATTKPTTRKKSPTKKTVRRTTKRR